MLGLGLQGEEPKPVDPIKKSVGSDVTEWAVQNDNQPLWTRNPRSVRYRLPVFELPCLQNSFWLILAS